MSLIIEVEFIDLLKVKSSKSVYTKQDMNKD
jgi:hypothetical protein